MTAPRGRTVPTASPVYDPASPVYDPASPVYDPASPVYDPASPVYDLAQVEWIGGFGSFVLDTADAPTSTSRRPTSSSST
ncbi:hypothetical protein HC030_05350 [Planosporangium mesophilum]|uniref:hypothetical protein n=1 Tax=Planosporangium mesophilum TaxID=689768 RepID=UPI00143C4647|nr:hypothetical protein [Planosporangium mesophilum]NJC81995.1 hypothetical protein [Planosporangium mesophilum]